jgi:hypothetical protein
MDIDLIILGALGSIWLLVMVMQTNVSLAIMGLCAGYVFSDLLADDVVTFLLSNTDAANVVPIVSVVSITLILLPGLLILSRFRQHQKGRFVQHIIPAIGFSLLATVLIFNNLPFESTNYLYDNSIAFRQYDIFKVLIAAAVVGIAIVDVVLHDGEHKRKYKTRHKS